MTEIERKFLIDKRLTDTFMKFEPLYQAYVIKTEKESLRVRITTQKAELTIKDNSSTIERSELNQRITKKFANRLLSMCDNKIEKFRFILNHNDIQWEIDVFSGDNLGLVMGEVEFKNQSEANAFNNSILPDWVLQEVTGIPKYYNINLINKPYSEWPTHEKIVHKDKLKEK